MITRTIGNTYLNILTKRYFTTSIIPLKGNQQNDHQLTKSSSFSSTSTSYNKYNLKSITLINVNKYNSPRIEYKYLTTTYQQRSTLQSSSTDKEIDIKGDDFRKLYPTPKEFNLFLDSIFYDTKQIYSTKLLKCLENNERFRNPATMYFIFKWLCTHESRDLQLYNYILKFIASDWRKNMVFRIIRYLFSNSIYNTETYNIIIAFQIDIEKPAFARAYLDKLITKEMHMGLKLNIDTYIQMIRVYGHDLSQINKIDAKVAYEKLPKEGHFNGEVINQLLTHHQLTERAIRIYEYEKAWAKFHNTKVPLCVFRGLLIGLAKCGMQDLFSRYWREMDLMGVEPTAEVIAYGFNIFKTKQEIEKFYKPILTHYPQLATDSLVSIALFKAILNLTNDAQELAQGLFQKIEYDLVMTFARDTHQAYTKLFGLYDKILIASRKKGFNLSLWWCVDYVSSNVSRILQTDNTVTIPISLLDRVLISSVRCNYESKVIETIKLMRYRRIKPAHGVLHGPWQYYLARRDYKKLTYILEYLDEYRHNFDLRFLPDIMVFFDTAPAEHLQRFLLLQQACTDMFARLSNNNHYRLAVSRIMENYLMMGRIDMALKKFSYYQSSRHIRKTFYCFMVYYNRNGEDRNAEEWKSRLLQYGYRFNQQIYDRVYKEFNIFYKVQHIGKFQSYRELNGDQQVKENQEEQSEDEDDEEDYNNEDEDYFDEDEDEDLVSNK